MNDPKVLLATLALVVSVAAFIVSLINLRITRQNLKDQNLKWDALNDANVNIKSPEMVIRKKYQVPEEEIDGMKWGGDPILVKSIDNNGEFHQLSVFVAMNKATNRMFENFSPRLTATLNDILPEIRRWDIPIDGYYISRLLTAKFYFENDGKIDANNLKYKIYIEIDGAWVLSRWSEMFTILTANITSHVTVNYLLKLSQEVPKEIRYKIQVEYEDRNKNNIIKETIAIWLRDNNGWAFIKSIT